MNGIVRTLVDDWQSAGFVVLKTLALFLTAAVAFRFIQRRAIAAFTPFDWLTAVATGAVIGRTATAPHTSWVHGAVAVLTLIAANALITRLRFMPRLHRLVDPPLRVLIRDGKVDHRNLRRCGLTEGDLYAILREHGHLNVAGVKLALFERTGSVSVVPASTPASTSRGTPRPRDQQR